MNEHKKVFKTVAAGQFPAQLAETLYPTDGESNTVYDEFMDLVREKNYDHPELEKEYFEHDGILSLFPQRGRERGFRNIHVSFEIKTHYDDLAKDSKMDQYLASTDFFFIVVPSDLLTAAVRKIRTFGARMPYVGLVDATTGNIVVMPAMQEGLKDQARQDRILSKIYQTKRRVDRPEACYQLRSIELGTNKRPEFVPLAGMNVNKEYLKLVGRALPQDPL